jgi:hypothetical protein
LRSHARTLRAPPERPRRYSLVSLPAAIGSPASRSARCPSAECTSSTRARASSGCAAPDTTAIGYSAITLISGGMVTTLTRSSDVCASVRYTKPASASPRAPNGLNSASKSRIFGSRASALRAPAAFPRPHAGDHRFVARGGDRARDARRADELLHAPRVRGREHIRGCAVLQLGAKLRVPPWWRSVRAARKPAPTSRSPSPPSRLARRAQVDELGFESKTRSAGVFPRH